MDTHAALTLIETGLAECRVAFDHDAGLYATLLTAGLMGGWSHCAGMCGPFVLAQVTARLEQVPAARMGEFHRLTGAAAVPYHFGRATTYAILGAVAALVTGSLGALPGLRWLSAALLAFAALFFAVTAIGGLTAWMSGFGRPLQNGWSERIGRLARPLLGRPVGWRGYALGVALGFIPCGLLYGAVAVAAAAGSALSGALGMLAFVLGTVPGLVAVGLAGHLAGRAWRSAVTRIAPLVMGVNAAVLGTMAWRLIA